MSSWRLPSSEPAERLLEALAWARRRVAGWASLGAADRADALRALDRAERVAREALKRQEAGGARARDPRPVELSRHARLAADAAEAAARAARAADRFADAWEAFLLRLPEAARAVSDSLKRRPPAGR